MPHIKIIFFHNIRAIPLIALILLTSNAIADVVMGRQSLETPSNVDQAIKSDPNNADLYNIRGNKLLLEKNYTGAIEDFNAAIKINPNYSEPYNGLGIAYRNTNQLDKAIVNYSKAVSLNPNYFEAYNNLGVAYMHAGNIENMCSSFAKACELGSCNKITASRNNDLCLEQQRTTDNSPMQTNSIASSNPLINIATYFLLYISIPLVVRYAILRKPVKSRATAILILIPIFIGFSMMINSQREEAQEKIYQQLNMPYNITSHMFGSPLLYLAMAMSYGILRSGSRKKTTLASQ